MTIIEQQLQEALLAKLEPLRHWCMSLHEAIRVAEEQVASLESYGLRLVVLPVEDSEQQPSSPERPPLAGCTNQYRRVVSGVTVLKCATVGIEHAVDKCHQQLPSEVAMNAKVCITQYASRSMTAARDTPQNASRRSHTHGCAYSFSGNVPKHDAEATVS